jgi:hypothetical protein
MPAINFKAEFVPLIQTGKKTQTIRKLLNIRIGQFVHLYTGQRTKKCIKIAVGIVTSIKPITIHEDSEIEVGGMYLSHKFAEDFSINDGFNCLDDFIDFFKNHYGLPFNGILISWRLYDYCSFSSLEYMHKSLKPINTIQFTNDSQIDLFGNECTGYCAT